jgi:hypothetical protein
MGEEEGTGVGAQQDAAAVVRAAFGQAERITKQAEEDRIAAATLRAVAEADAVRIRAEAEAERERLLVEIQRDRVAAEEVLIRARAEAEREADEILGRASELARREAEILLEGSKMELLRARDEATAIRAAAERDAEAIISAATSRARSTSAEILAATRRRLGDAPRGDAPRAAVGGDVGADRPPAGPSSSLVELAALTEFVSGRRPDQLVDAIVEEARIVTAWHERRYRMNWPKTPRPEDIENLIDATVRRALEKVFAMPSSRLQRSWAEEPWLKPADAEVIDFLDARDRRSA